MFLGQDTQMQEENINGSVKWIIDKAYERQIDVRIYDFFIKNE